MAKCKSCGAEIKFVRMPTGRSMPVEVKSDQLLVLIDGEWLIKKGFRPHWESCPGADSHRKPKLKSGRVGPLQTRPE